MNNVKIQKILENWLIGKLLLLIIIIYLNKIKKIQYYKKIKLISE